MQKDIQKNVDGTIRFNTNYIFSIILWLQNKPKPSSLYLCVCRTAHVQLKP